MIIEHKLTLSQCEALLCLTKDRGTRLKEEYHIVLKCKHLGIDIVNDILSAMEANNQLILDLERLKKEV